MNFFVALLDQEYQKYSGMLSTLHHIALPPYDAGQRGEKAGSPLVVLPHWYGGPMLSEEIIISPLTHIGNCQEAGQSLTCSTSQPVAGRTAPYMLPLWLG